MSAILRHTNIIQGKALVTVAKIIASFKDIFEHGEKYLVKRANING
jgi:hypothetical protein